MAHPKELIEKCIEKLSEDYPTGEYIYEVEKGIPGTKARPDILIFKEGEVICAVEIGYTRPEKIQLYRNLGIKDIRWYSKELELVLHEPDSEFAIGELEARAAREAIALKKKAIDKALRIKEEKYEQEANEILNLRPYILFFEGHCEFCEQAGIDDPDCGEMVVFDRRGYNIVFECEDDKGLDRDDEGEVISHDYEEWYSWSDEEGPYYGKYDEFLLAYIDFMMRRREKSK